MDLEPSDLARLRRGDVRALEACYRAFAPRVRRLCRNLLGRDDSEDATHEVFVKVFERAAQFTGDSRFSTWIYRVTVNHCLHRIERETRRRTESLSEELDVAAACRASSDVDQRDCVERWLAELCADQRAVLLLREIEGLDYREIAEVLALPIGTVMSRLHRARRRLSSLARDATAAAAEPRGPRP